MLSEIQYTAVQGLSKYYQINHEMTLMKKNIQLILLPLIFLFSQTALSAGGSLEVFINYVGYASETHPVAAVQSSPSYSFEHSTQLGTCPMDDGKIFFDGNPGDSGMVSVLIAAKMANRKVRIYWHDSHVSERGYCKLSNVQLI